MLTDSLSRRMSAGNSVSNCEKVDNRKNHKVRALHVPFSQPWVLILSCSFLSHRLLAFFNEHFSRPGLWGLSRNF